MSEFIIKLFIFLVGYGMGFLTACMGAAQIVAEKHDLRIKVAKLEAEKEALKKEPEVIEIKDHRQNLDGLSFPNKEGF